MNKKELIKSIKEVYATSTLRTRKEKGTKEFEIMASKSYSIFNRYSDATINSMYNKQDLIDILEFVLSQVTIEEVEVEVEDMDQYVIESSVEINELFNNVSDLFTNIEIISENELVIEDCEIPIQIIYIIDGLFSLYVNDNIVGNYKYDEIMIILKNLPQKSKLE
ncbi:hypothetical protein DLn1_00035 [Bacillus phage DLn1]|nr:hypothetical protein DLn1_00035 [Bacillus phage DLn1]